MKSSEIHNRLSLVFKAHDPQAQIEVMLFSNEVYWGKVVSVIWEGRSVTERTKMAKDMIDTADPALRQTARILVLPVTRQEHSVI